MRDDDARGWPPDAAALLERAVSRHGGWETWHALRRITLLPERLSGAIPVMKGLGRTFEFPPRIVVLPHERRTIFEGYPDGEHVGVYERGSVRIETRDGGIVQSDDDHRASFRGLAKYRLWSPLDALYFFGYAITHYHSLPFSLRDARLVSFATRQTRRGRMEILEVDLPDDLVTHSRRQTFHFDETGLLVRHDYHAEIIGWMARGAHFWKRHRTLHGFPIAMERQVVPRLGTRTLPMSVLHATFADAEVELDRTAATSAADADAGERRR